MMQAMLDAGTPIPKAIKTAMEYAINADFKKTLVSADRIEDAQFSKLSDEAKKWQIEIDRPMISFLGSQRINGMMQDLKANPEDAELLKDICDLTRNLENLNIDLDLWKAQNILFEMHKDIFNTFYERAAADDELAKEWIGGFYKLEGLMQIELSKDKVLEIINGNG
jgi:hypothetical protein